MTLGWAPYGTFLKARYFDFDAFLVLKNQGLRKMGGSVYLGGCCFCGDSPLDLLLNQNGYLGILHTTLAGDSVFSRSAISLTPRWPGTLHNSLSHTQRAVRRGGCGEMSEPY